MIVGQDLKPPLDEAFLQHYGTKGMRWGLRRDPRNVASRAKDRAARRRARTNEDKAIDAARVRVNSGQTHRELKTAKATFKVEKKTLGRREARKHLNAAKLKAATDRDKAEMFKSGAETTAGILGAVGGIALAAAIGARHR